ncbi:hypothetical protein HNY73_017432 [Argiope bruennichi]|uniref:Uncharacterized protein n=1 Tax=Argiope bruennichi TaxID=94029 RepID=A0A8T0ECM6_ARGBR|nr:hypothetical protein HNY73_017432 [Argiope bruennichi]
MAYLLTGRKEDLISLVTELGLEVTEGLKVVQLKDLMTSAGSHDEEFTKNLYKVIIDQRLSGEKEAERFAAERQAERLFELEKLKFQQNLNEE